MEDFSAGQAHDPRFDGGPAPLDMLHADDNLGDEAAFPSTWQLLDSADAPND